MKKRELAVNGSFYPASCSEIKKYINHFNNILEKNNFTVDTNIIPKALISPHAGYIYSGFSANIVYRYLQNSNIKNIIVIGPSHRVYLEGISVSNYEIYPTPCGDLSINQTIVNSLTEKFDFVKFIPEVHKEHSTETQMPFIQHYKNDVNIVELVYGKVDFNNIAQVISYLMEDKDNFIVISTDLSHFYTQEIANELDNICLNGIKDLDLQTLNSGCEACGILGVKAIIKIAKELGLSSKILDYRTSADASNDYNKVVGYTSALFY